MTSLTRIFTGEGLGAVVILTGVTLLAPLWSRPDIFFSVTVETGLRESEPGRKILRNFRQWVMISGGMGLGIVLLGMMDLVPALRFALLPVGMLVELAGISVAYAAAHRRVMPFQVAPSSEREAIVGSRQIFATKTWVGLQLGPFLILGLAAFWLWRHWAAIPERYPIHWGMDGHPNGWGDRSFGSVFIFPILGMMNCAFLCLLLNGLARGTRRVHSSGPEALREAQNLKNVLRLLLGVEYWLAIIFSALSVLPLRPSSATAIMVASVGANLIILLIAILLAARNGQGGWRLARAEAMGKSPSTADRTPDDCWKGGIIYYNPADPAVWVEKRFGYGWTVNMGNPRAWAVLGGILFFSGAMMVLGLILSHK